MPWERGQVVVDVSRIKHHDYMKIVSDMTKEDLARKLWGILTKVTQWSAMTENILKQLSVSAFDSDENQNNIVVNIARECPWRMKSYTLPLSHVGYVYLLMSYKRQDKFYVGQTDRNIPCRLREHNTGRGAKETRNPAHMPWAPVAYITCTGSNTQVKNLQSLESSWQGFNAYTDAKGESNLRNCIENGERVIRDHNRYITEADEKLKLVVLVDY